MNSYTDQIAPKSRTSLEAIIAKGTENIIQLTGLKLLGVVGAIPEESNYLLKIELIEREGIPNTMDSVGLYEVNVDPGGNLISYSRVDMRKRGEHY
ncbi:gas vesicle protein GvpO [Hydrogenispora ethanolica]|jgi:hypothetical protein|uniref:Gas vesicle protein GvpO n=1 Tax=Hydrogenispora ethanolica TaxID=1082276 RepID=A0A4R1QUN5_HYDET|nr:gas vesicle protein GvpO [Hydrogenispora ethanolica]TCL56801.1 gas vesicle protein GvpO [Hydrogenispora ethanolica]